MNHSTEQFKVEQVDSTPTTITFKVELQNIKSDSSATIILNVYQQDHSQGKENLKKMGNIYLKHPFKEHYTIEDLSALTTYKMNFFLTVKQSTYHATVFANTVSDPKNPKKFKAFENSKEILQNKKAEGPFSKTESLLYKYTDAKSTNLPIYKNDKDLKKNILDARSAKQWQDYQSSGYKFARPKENFEQRKKRMWLVANGFEIFDEVNDLVKEKGFNVMHGDWFMGPFYSYDHNFKKNGR